MFSFAPGLFPLACTCLAAPYLLRNMKNLILLFTCAFAFVFVAEAQQAILKLETFRVGSQAMQIPSPEGFVNGYQRIPKLTSHMKALEVPGNKFLAVYLTRAMAAKITKGEKVERLEFYATVGVQDPPNNADITPEMFTEFVSSLERDLQTSIDFELPRAVVASRKALSEQWDRPANVSLLRPVVLGFIDKKPNVSTVMMMTTILNDKQRIAMLAVFGHVVVNKRVLYVNIYKELTTDEDAAALRDFTRKWTAEIIAANK
jgi:hypothetical protein